MNIYKGVKGRYWEWRLSLSWRGWLYWNPDYGHDLTGNLNIVTNIELKYNLKFGPKCKLKRIGTKNIVFKRFTKNVDIFIQKLVYRYGLPTCAFTE